MNKTYREKLNDLNLMFHGFFWPGMMIGAISLMFPPYCVLWWMSLLLILGSCAVIPIDYFVRYKEWERCRKAARFRRYYNKFRADYQIHKSA